MVPSKKERKDTLFFLNQTDLEKKSLVTGHWSLVTNDFFPIFALLLPLSEQKTNHRHREYTSKAGGF
jgi:hypothetical protein